MHADYTRTHVKVIRKREEEMPLIDNKASTSLQREQMAPPSEKQASVRFCRSVRVVRIKPLNHYTPSERKACWYDNADYKAILKSNKRVLKRMEAEEVCGCTEYCTLGLEKVTPEGSVDRQIIRMASWLAVLQEQERQWQKDIHDPELIAFMYRATIIQRQKRSQRLASDVDI